MRKTFWNKALCLLMSSAMVLSLAACGTSSTQEETQPEATTAAVTQTDSSQEDAADTVIYSNITTTQGDEFVEAEAIAIKDGSITYIGAKDGADAYIGDDTQVLDYSDSYVLPGLIDGHTHAYVSAENKVCDFNLTECKNADECIEVIKKYVEENPKDFYNGYGWLDAMFDNGMPTADLLDAIDTDSPIYIKSEDCHSCWTNTAMMEKCGITSESENPKGGVIEHYENGQPAGCFRDTAMDTLIKPNVPVYSVDEYKDILLLAQDEYIALGYTSYNDVIIDVDSADNIVEAYHELDEEGKLKCYVNASYIVNNNEEALDNVQHVKDLADETAGEHFKLTDIKFFMDGITESCTSYMSEAYNNNPDNYGVDRWEGEESTQRLYDAVTLCNDLGLVAHFHAIGDAAVSKALDAAEYAKEHSTNPDMRNVMTHIQFISDEDCQRFADLNMYASCDFGWCYTDNAEMNDDPDYQNIEITNLGEERVNEEMRYKSLLDAGVTVAFATDYPATSNVDPFMCMELGVTRMHDGMESTINDPEEAVTNEDVLRAITINTAEQLGRDSETGSLEVGKKANFIVINQDLLHIDANDYYDGTQVLHSYIDGNEVYTAK